MATKRWASRNGIGTALSNPNVPVCPAIITLMIMSSRILVTVRRQPTCLEVLPPPPLGNKSTTVGRTSRALFQALVSSGDCHIRRGPQTTFINLIIMIPSLLQRSNLITKLTT